MQTDRLYFADSAVLEFTATVLETERGGDVHKVILDRTAFYPTGGGQPNDTGRMGDADVIDVNEDESGRIIHTLKGGDSIIPGRELLCTVDAARRLDHLQQHSGQHILSQAFIQACGAETRSFHLGAVTSTIDIDLHSPSDEHMGSAEEIANQIIFEDRPMRVHFMTEEQAGELPLRKESAVRGTIRVIEVEGFDWSPCGGTHAARTGQVGLIAVKSFERAKKMTRVEFVCGRRALLEYRSANSTATRVARLFSADRESAVQAVERMIQDNKALQRRIRELLQTALVGEAAELLSKAESAGGAGSTEYKVVRAIFDRRDVEELRLLAWKVIERAPAVALLGTRDGSNARLVFARSPNLPQDMGALLSEACQILGGRGGGKPDMAQGGGPNIDKLEEAISVAISRVS
ncbi:MAG TPA: DHHA1 domain-containing protein [Blastocatellia bacterium]|nr:DHHA1 domain-containing protein [Blastocatellia bacterium]